MLVLNNVEAIYSDVILAVKGISMTVPAGTCVTLLGGNGAGKSTTLKAISNLIRTEDGKVTAGSIEFDGQRIDGGSPEGIVRAGLVHIMEGRRVLRHLTVKMKAAVTTPSPMMKEEKAKSLLAGGETAAEPAAA